MVTGKLRIMGKIETVEPDGEKLQYPMALLIEFDSAEDIRAAMKNMECKFRFESGGEA